MSEPESLELRIRAWLNKQGYPLEMETAAAVRAEGLTVAQSQHYVDPETQKSREMDVFAFVDDSLGLASFRLVIECKSSNKPWVVFSSEHTPFNRLFALGILSESLRTALADGILEVPKELVWFWKEGRIGYGVSQAFSEGDDVPFSATMSAVKGALWQHASDGRFVPPLLGAFPVVVVNAPVFECYLDNAGSVHISQVPAIDYFFGARIGDFAGTCVRIVSAPAVPSFAREAKAQFAILVDFLEPAIKRHWDELRQRG